MAKYLFAKYRGGYMGDHALQRGKVRIWRDGDDLVLRAVSGCIVLYAMFPRKFRIPVAEIERIEAVPARVRGADVQIYTHHNGVLALGFPYDQAPQAKAYIRSLVGSGVQEA